MTLKHIFFDNDGTIVDSEVLAMHAMLRRFADMGIQMDVPTFASRYPGFREVDILRMIEEEYQVAMPETMIAQLHGDYVRLFDTELKAIAGMDTLFRAIKLPKSMVSNGSVQHVRLSFQRVGMAADLPDTIFSYEHVPKPKPAPDVYLYALQQTGTLAHEALVIEDSPTGVLAAKAAGIKTVGFLGATHIPPGHEVKLLECGADYLAENAEELTSILARFGAF
jgi:HAD superfamily hydrolase (TIGR01509 family)